MKMRVKPSKASSLISVVAGVAMVGMGVAWVVPKFGAFGVIWILMAVIITGYHVLNLVSGRGVAVREIDVEGVNSARLQRLENLRASNLITESEYQAKRAEIIDRL